MKITDLVNALFPFGYIDFDSVKTESSGSINSKQENLQIGRLPYLCTDLFAVSASLLQRSGAYHHIAPEGHSSAPDGYYSTERLLNVSEEERKRWKELGMAWRGLNGQSDEPPPGLPKLWDEFWQYRNSDVYKMIGKNDQPPAWWRPALGLFCIADETARGMGFESPSGKASFQEVIIMRMIDAKIVSDTAVFSFSLADADIVCIAEESDTSRRLYSPLIIS